MRIKMHLSAMTLAAVFCLVSGRVFVASADSLNSLFLSDVNSASPTTSYGPIQAGYTSDPTNVADISSTSYAYTAADQGYTNAAGFIIPEGSYVPAILINTDTTGSSKPLGLSDGQLLLHPGNPSNGGADSGSAPFDAADLRYTAPVTGIYNISGAFSELPGNNPTLDGIYVNGVIFGATESSNNNPNFYDPGIFLTKDEPVDFVVSSPSANAYSESTGLFASVTAVPLPKAVWTGAALLGAVALAKLRRSSVQTIAF